MDAKPLSMWAEMKLELEIQFGENLDSQSKLLKLHKYKQRKDQELQIF